MKIKQWAAPSEQMARLGRHHWSVSRLIELSRALPVIEIPLNHLHLFYKYESLTIREMVMHMKAVHAADLNAPIIIDEDGEIMDGRHRLMKAMLEGAESIKAVRFDENPPPCRVDQE
jgi:hypothetical protein